VDRIADAYEAKFAVFKPQRKLEWMSTLGTVNLSLSLQDRTIDVAVPPIQAAIIGAFDGDRGTRKQTILCVFSRPFFFLASATLNELANELGMNPTSLQKRIAFWVQKGVLKEDPPNTYTIVEVLASGSAANGTTETTECEIIKYLFPLPPRRRGPDGHRGLSQQHKCGRWQRRCR